MRDRTIGLVALTLLLLALGAGMLQAQTSAVPPRRPATPAAAPGLTNADIVKLVQAGLSEALVIGKIRQEKQRRFDVSAEGMLQLKTAGVPESVIAVMLDPDTPLTSTPPAGSGPSPVGGPTVASPAGLAPAPDAAGSNDLTRPREPGIYIDTGGDVPALVALEPTVFSQGKSGGFFASAMTYGLYKAKWKAVIRSARANQRTTVQRPTFYFYFEQKSANLGAGVFAGWLAAATSPNEFVLAQMTRKRDERELIVGEFGAFSSSAGTRSQDTVPLKIEKLAPGIYRVIPDEVLGPGEFCFFYAAGASSLGGGAVGKLFDFGVDAVSAKP